MRTLQVRKRKLKTNVKYSKEELSLIDTLIKEKTNFSDVASTCNEIYHSGRPIRTARGIEYVSLDKLKLSKKRFKKICNVCEKEFSTSWPIAKYCSEECRAVIDREYGFKRYHNDPVKEITINTKRVRARVELRWKIIFQKFGDFCGVCKLNFPRVCYDLHHPLGKSSRKETPSRVIRAGTNEVFQNMLDNTVLLCANCHRKHHATTGDWGPKRTYG